MDNGLIPRRYAKALYKFALEHGSTQAVYDEMKQVVEAFRQNPTLQNNFDIKFVLYGYIVYLMMVV